MLLTKDKEIDKLTKKTLSLCDSMSNHSRHHALQSQFDMTTALRQSTKEKILLEMKSNGTFQLGSSITSGGSISIKLLGIFNPTLLVI